MKIIILEGIATSGKTSIKNLLVAEFKKKGMEFSVIDENQTLMPILDNADKDVSIQFLRKILNKALSLEKDVLIFDRLYFTHIFRTASNIDDFSEIEKMLSEHDVLLALLTIDEQKISERIQFAISHRDGRWIKFVRKKGNDAEIEKYYVEQQQLLLGLLNKTRITHIVENSTSGDFEGITEAILKRMC